MRPCSNDIPQRNLFPLRMNNDAPITRPEHHSLVVWFTGLSGAGKTTLATLLEQKLSQQGCRVRRLDGDVLRQGPCRDLGFSLEDRRENIRRAGMLAGKLADAGFIVLVALISPLREDRERVRNSFGPGRFIEVFVNAPLETCEQRDAKGLYRKARAGVISEFTGVSSPYEPPLSPELDLQTNLRGIEECLQQLHGYLNHRLAPQLC